MIQNNKTQTKCQSKMIQYAIITHLICPIGLHETWKFMHTDCQVTHTLWKLTGTYSGCHIIQQIQHISLCCHEPWHNKVPSPKQHHQDNTNKHMQYQKMWFLPVWDNLHQDPAFIKMLLWINDANQKGRITTVVTHQWVQLMYS